MNLNAGEENREISGDITKEHKGITKNEINMAD